MLVPQTLRQMNKEVRLMCAGISLKFQRLPTQITEAGGNYEMSYK